MSKKPKKRGSFGVSAISSRLKRIFAGVFPSREQFGHLPKVLSKKERYVILVLLIIALAALIAVPVSSYYHYSKEAPGYGGSFTEGMVGAPKHINPLIAQSSDVDRDLSELVYAGLMKYDDRGNLVNGLAQSYNISDDGLTYTFKLRDDLKWQDGQPLTADDVVFSILTAQNSDYGSDQKASWTGVDVNKIDDKTVSFKLKLKFGQFLGNTTLGILPKHIWENIKPASFGLSDYNLKPIGAGPYKFSRMKKDSSGEVASYELIASDNYYEGNPYISKITFNFYISDDDMIAAYNNGEIDNISSVSPEKINSVRFLGKLKINKLQMPRYFAVFFNPNQSEQFSDKNVRLALNYATNKQSMVDKILSGNGSVVDSPMLPGIIGIPDPTTKYGFDIDKAKKILDAAGWVYNEQDKVREKAPPPSKTKKTAKESAPAQPKKLEIKLTTSNWPELTAVANQLKNDWQTAGVKVNLEILTLSELQQAIKDRSYESLLFGEVLGLDPDPMSFWHSSQKKDPGLNLAEYDNQNADKLLIDARQTLDRQARFLKYADFQNVVIADAPAIFLYSPDYLYAQNSNIKGFDTKIISIPSDRFNTINKWYINTTREFK